jgi:predicted DNA-binding transcriptional regulator YafY
MKQMDRRLLILMRLRDEVPLRAADLARACECSVRTIYRDIDALCQAGVPVAAMPGEGYRLVQGYHLPPIAFTAEEAVQLLLGSDLAVGLGTVAQRESARSAAAKVEAVLLPETRREVERLRERIRVSSWIHRDGSPWLPLLQDGVTSDRVVRLRYHSYGSDELTEREVEPYYLVFYGGDWHLVGYCRLRDGVRDFRASRIRSADLLDEQFERPESIGYDHHPSDVPRPAREVRVWIEASAVPWARESRAYGFVREEPAEGGQVFVFNAWELRRLMPWLLSWGASARVLSPPEAARHVLREAEALVHAYAEE